MKQIIKVGSRDSKLAVIQAKIVMECIKKNSPTIELQLITMKTSGDILLDQPLDKVGGKGLFVKELDIALQNGEIDISVHSLKDMPALLSDDLPLLAYSKREDPRDALVLPLNENELLFEKPIGCSSARRKIQLYEIYNNVSVKPIRGNVPTRLNKLDNGEYSALVLASAGLIRLGLCDRISRIFSTEQMIPAAGQGIIVVQGRKDFDSSILKKFHDKESNDASLAEREFIKTLDGGCSAPTAGYAQINGNEIKLMGLYVDEKTEKKARGYITGDRVNAQKMGYQLAKRLLQEAEYD